MGPILDRVRLQSGRFSETWRLPTGLVQVTANTEEIDPLNPRADLAVTITLQSGVIVTECVNQNMTYVLIGIPADPTLPINLGPSGVNIHNGGGGELNGELLSGIYLSTLQTVATNALTFVASYAAVEDVFIDTGFPGFLRLDNSCAPNQNIGFAALSNSFPSSPSNVLRVDLYTAP